MNDLSKIYKILSSLLQIYKELFNIAKNEREYLINLNIEKLTETIELKQYISLNIKKLEDSLKDILLKYNVESINEFLLIADKKDNVDDVRLINGKLKETIETVKREFNINQIITNESVSFYNSMIDMYMGFLKNRGNNYDKDAAIEIAQNSVGLKV